MQPSVLVRAHYVRLRLPDASILLCRSPGRWTGLLSVLVCAHCVVLRLPAAFIAHLVAGPGPHCRFTPSVSVYACLHPASSFATHW